MSRELWANNNSGSSDIGRQHGWIRPLLSRRGRWRHRFSVGRTDRGTTARTSVTGQYNMNDDVPVVVDVPITSGSLGAGMGFRPVLVDVATGCDDVMSDVSGLEDDDCGDGAEHGDEQVQDPSGGNTQMMMSFGEYQTSEGTFDSIWGMTTWCILDGPQHDENRFAENGMDEDGCHHHNGGRQQRAWTWSETRPRADVP